MIHIQETDPLGEIDFPDHPLPPPPPPDDKSLKFSQVTPTPIISENTLNEVTGDDRDDGDAKHEFLQLSQLGKTFAYFEGSLFNYVIGSWAGGLEMAVLRYRQDNIIEIMSYYRG